jgi:hypothetical protein
MKLTDIDLNDKTEVAAAHALLAAVLGEAILQVPAQRELPLDAPSTASQVFALPGLLPADAPPEQDPAVIFGGQSAAPLAPAAGATAPATALPDSGGTSVAPAAGGLLASVGLAVELDSSGLPWDARIHASTKSKKKDGTWTALRGLNDEGKVKQIEAELRATAQGRQLGAIVQAQSAAPLPGLPALAPASAAANVPPGIGSLSVAQATGAASVSPDPVTFEQLMPRVTQATISGILPPTALQQVCGALGLPSVVALQTNPAFVPHAWAQLKAAYPALQ